MGFKVISGESNKTAYAIDFRYCCKDLRKALTNKEIKNGIA